jgi:hypothetical protein
MLQLLQCVALMLQSLCNMALQWVPPLRGGDPTVQHRALLHLAGFNRAPAGTYYVTEHTPPMEGKA